jgi:hypothetical protein
MGLTTRNIGCSLVAILPRVSCICHFKSESSRLTSSGSRHFVPRFTIPLRRATHSIGASCRGACRLAGRLERDAEYQEGARLVCAVF